MITKLTKEQEKQIPVFIDKVLNFVTEPTNKNKATKAIQNFYEFAGHKKPIVIFAKSPIASVIMVAMYQILFKNKLLKSDQLGGQLGDQLDGQLQDQLRGQLDGRLRGQLGDQLGDQLYDQLGGQLGDQLRDQLGGQLYDQLGGQLGDQLYDQLGGQLGGQLRDQLGDQLGGQLDDQLGGQLGGQLDDQLKDINNNWWLIIWWLTLTGVYMFGKYIGFKFDNKLFKLFFDLTTNISFMIPYRGIVFISGNPKRIDWKNKRLHNENKAAVEYADGYSLYMISGVRVNEKIVKHPETLTKEDWLNEKNLEVKRVIQERMGTRFPVEVGGKVVGKHADRRIGEIVEVDIAPDPEKVAHFLHARDWSTGRMYFIPIPPAITDPMEAQAWTFSNKTQKIVPENVIGIQGDILIQKIDENTETKGKNELTKEDMEMIYSKILSKKIARA